jgi:hypothetical protein
MENHSHNGPVRGLRRGRSDSVDDEEDEEEMDDDLGVRAMFVEPRSLKKHKRVVQRTAEPQESPAERQHRETLELRDCQLAALGAVNKNDPLTDLPLEVSKPIALLISEEAGAITAFDLFSLYHVVLKKGKNFFKTLFYGKFTLQNAEVVSLTNQFGSYYGLG